MNGSIGRINLGEKGLCYFSSALLREGKAEELSLMQLSSELKLGLESTGPSLPCQSWMLWGSTEGQMTRALCE